MDRYIIEPVDFKKGKFYYGTNFFEALDITQSNIHHGVEQNIFVSGKPCVYNMEYATFVPIVDKKKEGEVNYDLSDDGTGKKYDTGKPMIGTAMRVFPLSMEALGAVIEFGTHKYPQPDNWKKVEGANYRYLDSLMRHLIKHLKGQEFDEETGKPHLAHVVWNALAILELYLMGKNENENK